VTFEHWLSQLDLTQISFSVLVALGIGLFIWRKVWPWFVDDYWVNRTKRLEVIEAARADTERERTGVFAMMRDTLVELKVIAAQQVVLMQQHDNEMKTITKTLIEQQHTLLEQIKEFGEKV
jgi:hypothetical protein